MKRIFNRIVKTKWSIRLILPALIVLIGTAVYLPGLSGPFLFDDRTNIHENRYLKIKTLDYESLVTAAFSVNSGPLKRPIPMLSFALNYYFSGETFTALHFKITNLVIHLVNGLLVFWLFRLIFNCTSRKDSPSCLILYPWPHHAATSAFIVSVLWLINPIQLTSVLYVVQRMTSLSALFVLLGLICYVTGRIAIQEKRKHGLWIILAGTSLFGALGIFSKENAVLLPLFMLAIEITVFSRSRLLDSWDKSTTRNKYLILAVALIIVSTLLVWAFYYFSPSYDSRHFSLSERLYTESRVIFYYLNLIVLPRLYEFGIFHDDIIISKNLIAPVTTIFSVAGIITLLVLAFICLRKFHFVSLGIFWFIIGHLLESTFIPLEIAHEHRNYLASIGPMLVILILVMLAAHKTDRKSVFLIIPLFALLFSVNTALRSWHWSDSASLYNFEAENHPHSARAQASMGSLFAEIGKLEEAKKAFIHASKLRPHDASDLINVHIILSWQNIEASEKLKLDTLDRVKHGLWTALTGQVLEYAVNCLPQDCGQMQNELLTWLPVYISRAGEKSRRRAYNNYLYARALLSKNDTQAAITALNAAIEAYSNYLHPYFLLSAIHLQQKEVRQAKVVLKKLEKANIDNPHPGGREIQVLSDKIMQLRKGALK